MVAAGGGGQRLQLVFLARRPRLGRLPHGVQQLACPCRRLGHRVFEPVGGETVVAEQPRLLGAQRHRLGGDGAIVRGAAVLAAHRPRLEGAFAEVAPRRELQERFDGGARQGDDVLAGVAARLGRAGCGIDQRLRQAVEIVGAVEHQLPSLLIREKVLAELGPERRKTLVDRCKACLVLGRQCTAGAGEADMVSLQHAGLLRRQAELVATPPQVVDAAKQLRVEVDRGGMTRQHRRDGHLDGLELVGGVGAGQVEEDGGDAVQRFAGTFHRLDGVGEARRLRIGGDRLDLRPVLRQSRIESRAVMFGPHRAERRRLERSRPRLEQRVGGNRHGDP